jgi:hypothetical protein
MKNYTIEAIYRHYESFLVVLKGVKTPVYLKLESLKGICLRGNIVHKRTRSWLETTENINYRKVVDYIIRYHKKILPVLLGIDAEFDKLLAVRLRETKQGDNLHAK